MAIRMNYLEAVHEFHEKFNVRPNPQWEPDPIDLRITLIIEELTEFLKEANKNTPDKVKTAKELADLLYVTFGMADSLGIPIDEVFRRVHESNMSKLGPDGKPVYREDGKVLKGPNYKEPNLEDLFVSN